MNRRNAIGSIIILSAGAIVLPSCGQKDEASIKLKNLSLTGDDEKMLASLSDSIIPAKNFAGADVEPHEFTLVMVDDCYDPGQQKKYSDGLRAFNEQAKSRYGSSFPSCAPAQKMEWLGHIEKKKDIPDDLLFFYETTKRHTVQALTSSGDYMTNIMKYKMVPGSNFKGCVKMV